jgi:hypothetical protein
VMIGQGVIDEPVVLYLGERSYSYDDRLHVMPVDRLWTEIG